MQRTLTLEQSPPLAAVLRYFLSVPLFVALAGALLLWQGAPALASRWSGPTLALTHLMTLGGLGMAMAGALIQILPVVAGTELPRAELLARGVHLLLAGGTAALAAAFLTSHAWLFQLAVLLLVGGFGWLIATLTVGLWQSPAPGAIPMLATVRLALAALLVTVVLGGLLAAGFGWPAHDALLPLMAGADLHAMWAVFGWAGLLLIGVSFQVVPMFQVTALYPERLVRAIGVLIFLLLVAATALALAQAPAALAWLARALLLACYVLFAFTTLKMLAQRKRDKPDAMTRFWCLAMGSLLACAALWIMPEDAAGGGRTLAMGVLAIGGFLYSTVNGMLYKIVPFLMWHHLSAHAAPGYRAPTVKKIASDTSAQRQFWLHAASMVLLVLACWWPDLLARPAGLALGASALWLLTNLVRATRAQSYAA